MKNFIRFLVQYHAFFLFLGLEGLCLGLYLRSAEYPNAWAVNSASAVAGGTYSAVSSANEYSKLGKRNDSLAAVIAYLRAQLDNAYAYDTLTEVCLDDSLRMQLYTYLPAKVIRNSVASPANYITLNRGSSHGVEVDMGVICDQGVVGKVVKVSDNFSVVMSLLHPKFSLFAYLPESQVMGKVQWQSRNPRMATLFDIPSHVEPVNGDAVETAGYSSIFPEGIPVGTVLQRNKAEGTNFLEVDVELSTPFHSLRHVYVVNYLQREERSNLENAAAADGP
jgi:rod shape-determining protein MreC